MTGEPRSRAWPAVAAGLSLVVLTLAVYWPVTGFDFILYDDNVYLTENRHLAAGPVLETVAWAFTTMHAGNWHPLAWLSHMLDARVWGMDAGRHHLTSLILHAANAILLLILLKKATGRLWAGWIVALLFALHPLHVQPVAWLSERKELLAAFFWAAAMLAHVAYARKPSRRGYAATLLLLGLGLMSKPMVVTLPVILLALDLWPLNRVGWGTGGRGDGARRRIMAVLLREKAPMLALSLAAGVLTYVAQQRWRAVSSVGALPLGTRLANAAEAYIAYLGKMVWPARLAVFYPHPRPALTDWGAAAAVMVLAGMTWLAFAWRRRRPYLAWGWFWYIATLLPVIGLVQVGRQAMADRYTYIPLTGVFVAVSWWAADTIGRRRIRLSAVVCLTAVVLAAMAASTRYQLGFWRDGATLFRRALAVTENNFVAHRQLANILSLEGRVPEAMDHYREALRIDPGDVDANYNYGVALLAAGRPVEARESFLTVLGRAPDSAPALNNLGVLLDREGRLAEAAAYFRKAIDADPEFEGGYLNLGAALAGQGRREEEAETYRRLLRIAPGSAAGHFGLGVVLAAMGRADEAARQYQQTIRLDPGHVGAHNNMGVLLAAGGRRREAAAHYLAALMRAPGDGDVVGNLSRLLADAGLPRSPLDAYLAALGPGGDPRAAMKDLEIVTDRLD